MTMSATVAMVPTMNDHLTFVQGCLCAGSGCGGHGSATFTFTDLADTTDYAVCKVHVS